MLGPSPRKQQARKTRRERALVRGDGPVNDHLWMPMVLSSSRSTSKNKKSSRIVQGVPKAPVKDLPLVSNPHGGVKTRRCISIRRRIPSPEEGLMWQDY
jgi:hypothetical protein